MNRNEFLTKLGRAQELILSEDFNRKVEQKASSFSGAKLPNNPDFSSLERQAFGTSHVQMVNESLPRTDNTSRLPASMRESFASMPLMSGNEMSATPLGNITDSLRINEQKTVNAPVSTPSVGGGGIDYSLLNSIIEGAVRKCFSEMSEASAFKGMRFADGNKIQFIDSKGNLYEGVLKLKKKAQK